MNFVTSLPHLKWTACILAACLPPIASGASIDVREFGAKGDGRAKDTKAIQAAVDKASFSGGTAVLTPGTYLSGTIHLRSNVTLRIEQGATLIFSLDDADFDPYEELPYHATAPAKYKPSPVIPATATPFQRRRRSAPAAYDDEETNYFHYALLSGDGVRNASIEGNGEIDSNRDRRYGPKPIAFKNSESIEIRGITIRNAPNYAISLGGTDHVDIESVKIINAFADGIDPDGCRFIRITNSYIDSHDDAICAKASWALGKRRSVENLVVANCILRTHANHIKFGSESAGDLRNVSVTNCVLLPKDDGRKPHSGISIESVDGANIDGVAISDISMQDAAVPIFIRLGNRGRGAENPIPGSIQNISIRNVVATGASLTSSITGIEAKHIRNLTIDGLVVTAVGGGLVRDFEVPELPRKDPDAAMFGELPAFALYGRYVDGLTVKGLQAHAAKPDARPAIMLDDVSRLLLSGFSSTNLPQQQPMLVFRNVAGALLFGNRRSAPASLFFAAFGERSSGISVE